MYFAFLNFVIKRSVIALFNSSCNVSLYRYKEDFTKCGDVDSFLNLFFSHQLM